MPSSPTYHIIAMPFIIKFIVQLIFVGVVIQGKSGNDHQNRTQYSSGRPTTNQDNDNQPSTSYGRRALGENGDRQPTEPHLTHRIINKPEQGHTPTTEPVSTSKKPSSPPGHGGQSGRFVFVCVCVYTL